MTNAIEANGLVKRFGKTTALAGVDLVARPGTVLGVLGPNGAGKTTAVRILATRLDGRPRVLYLDEPTTGLDPRSRSDVWGMIRALVADGVTVLLTTQYLDEADQLAHDIVVIDHGKVIATGTPDELKDKSGGQVLQVAPADPALMAEVIALMANVTRAEVVTDAEAGVA